MNCTNCGSAATEPTGFCVSCGHAVDSTTAPPTRPVSRWPHPDGSGPVDVDATIEFELPTVERLEKNAAPITPGEHRAPDYPPVFSNFGPPPVSPAVGYGPPASYADLDAPLPAFADVRAAAGYGIDQDGLPNGPSAGRPYGEPTMHFGAPDPYRSENPPADPYRSGNPAADPYRGGNPAADPYRSGNPAGNANSFGGAGSYYGAQPYGSVQRYVGAELHSAAGLGGLARGQEEPVTAVPASSPYGDLPALYGTPGEVPNKFSVVALVLAGLALLVLPAGLAAMLFGSMARNLGEPLGPRSFTVAVAGTLVGSLVAAAVTLFMLH
jgi:hypothetical protein